MRVTIRTIALMMAACLALSAAEPIAGTWKLTKQSVNGQDVSTDDLTLRVIPSKDTFDFAYSVPMNGIHFVSMRFSSVRLDGSPADVMDAQGKRIGSVRITKAGNSEYIAIIEGPNRPTAKAIMTVSADGKTLKSESRADVPNRGPTTTVQLFARY